MISVHCSLRLLGSSNSHASAFWVSEITGMCHHAWLSFVFSVLMGFHHVGQAGLKSWPCDPPALASQNAGITGVSHRALPIEAFLTWESFKIAWDPTKWQALHVCILWVHSHMAPLPKGMQFGIHEIECCKFIKRRSVELVFQMKKHHNMILEANVVC